jgi:hypothetical protein
LSFLTGASDHVRVIEARTGSAGALADPLRPTGIAEGSKWDASEREVRRAIMSTASKLHRELNIITALSQSTRYRRSTSVPRCIPAPSGLDGVLLLSQVLRKDLYGIFCRREGPFARIDRIAPEKQTKAERAAELTLFGILLAFHSVIIFTKLS